MDRNPLHDLYDNLAGLFAYPGGDYSRKLEECRQAVRDTIPEAASFLTRFAERIAGLSQEEREELYTRTFDLNPLCSLDVSWHIFGENYGRGEFLVMMRQELRQHGLEESAELPDHLTHVLPVLARMEQPRADKFVGDFLLPALQKILAGVGEKDNPYEWLLEAVRCVVTSPYGIAV